MDNFMTRETVRDNVDAKKIFVRLINSEKKQISRRYYVVSDNKLTKIREIRKQVMLWKIFILTKIRFKFEIGKRVTS